MRKSGVGRAIALGAIALAMALFALSTSVGPIARAEQVALDCPITFNSLQSELEDAAEADSTGLNNDYWAVVVNREGAVCAVAYSGRDRDSQWLLSRQIAAAKAFTANGLSLENAPISTAQLYPWVQPGAPGNPLFGLAGGNPVSPRQCTRVHTCSSEPATIRWSAGVSAERSRSAAGSPFTPAAMRSAAWACLETPRVRIIRPPGD